MSYRIHLNIIPKVKFNKFYAKYYEASGEDNNPWYLPDVAKEHIELFDEIDLDQFKKLKLKQEEEYHPFVLSKKDFKKIIDLYQEHLLNLAKTNLERIAKIRREYDKDSSNKDEIVNDILSLLYSYDNLNFNIKWHFERLIGQDIMSDNSDYFLLQYFYLVRLYENYDFKKDVLIITHG